MADLTPYEKAVLDTIAYAEGTLGVSNNGYDVIVTFKLINGWTNDTKIVHGETDWYQKEANSDAAGRYQFLGSSWKSLFDKKNPPMTKVNQDTAAIKLVNKKLLATNIDSRAVSISQLDSKDKFDIFLQKCASTWASLPLTTNITIDGQLKKAGNGWYSGQGGKKTSKELYDIFILALTKYKANT